MKHCTLVKVLEYQVNFVSQRKVLIVTSMEVVGQESRPIGDPRNMDESKTPYSMTDLGAGGSTAAGGASASSGGAAGAPNTGSRGSGPVVPSSHSGPACVPVAHLNPYMNRWTIKVRVTSKSDIKTWNNDRGNGSLFKIDLLDDAGGEISAAFFKEAVTRFYDTVSVVNVYFMSGGRVKLADKRYSAGRDYEINFDDKASIVMFVSCVAYPTTTAPPKPPPYPLAATHPPILQRPRRSKHKEYTLYTHSHLRARGPPQRYGCGLHGCFEIRGRVY